MFILLIMLLNVLQCISASHQIAAEYKRTGYVWLERSDLRDISDYTISCILKSPTPIKTSFTWKWKTAHAYEPSYYFMWSATETDKNDHVEYASTLSWITNVNEIIKRNASGVIYAQGAHEDEPSDTTACADVPLTIIWKPTKPFVMNDNYVIDGETIQLDCILTDKGNPESMVVWIKAGSNYTGRGHTNPSINLNITKADDGTPWQCYYYNIAGQSGTSDVKRLNVIWQPEPCSLKLNPAEDYIMYGSKLILTCTCPDKGKPIGEITWSLNGNKQTGVMYKSDEVTIDTVESQHAGEWECYYKNGIGIGTPALKTIDVRWPPGKSLLLVNTHFPKLHDSFTLTCTGDQGNPKGRVVWYLDSLIFTNTTDITLNISSAAQEHSGDWSCLFYNHLDDGGISDSVRVQVLCLPSLYVEYVSYAFNESYVHFNLRLNDDSAADTVNVQVCSTPNDEPLCSTATSKLENKELISDVELPEPSDHTLYNVSFIFSHGSRIVSRHGIALRGIAPKGKEKQSNTSTIFAALFGALWIITAGIAAVVILLYHRRLKEMDVNPPKEKEAEVHYANVGAETGTDTVTYKTPATDYEDVSRDAAPISAHITENTTYMDLDQNDVQQTRNRPAELTVYQSLH